MVLLVIAAFLAYPSLLNARSLTTWLVLGAFIVVFTIVITMSDHLAVRPLLHDLPRSTQKISFADMIERQSQTMSVKALAIFIAIFVLAAAAGAIEALTASRPNAFLGLGAIVFTAFAVAFLAMLIMKLRARRTSE